MIAVLVAALLSANAFDDTFERATVAYDRGDYAGAVEALEQLVAQDVVDPVVFHNLGNAYYRSSRLALAIVNYERALYLDPNLEETRENLISCIKQTEQGLSKPQPPEIERNLLFWHYGMLRGTSLRLAAMFWALAWTLLAVRRVKTFPYLRRTAAAAMALAALFGASWWVKSSPQQLAVAAERKVPVHYGTSESETVRFDLYEGDRVAVDRRQDGWSRVETSGGERGWVKDEHMAFVGPPYLPPPKPPTASAIRLNPDPLPDALGYLE